MLDTIIHKYLRLPYRLHVHVDKRAKKAKVTVLLLHGMGNSAASWDEVVDKLPDSVRVISIDLLGFGTSPSPRWLKYSTIIQAKAVIATLMRLNSRNKLIIVGHSLGSLVAIEIAKRYPRIVQSMILCSPPLYSDTQKRTILPTQSSLLRRFYRLVQRHPKDVVTMVPYAMKLKIVGKAFNVTRDNVDVYMAALEGSVLDQTGFKDIQVIRKPMHIIHGMFDPVVVKKNLDIVVKANPYVTLSSVRAGHELIGNYIPAVVKAVEEYIPTSKKA